MKTAEQVREDLRLWNEQLDFNTNQAIHYNSTGNLDGYRYYQEMKEKCLVRINTLEWVLE